MNDVIWLNEPTDLFGYRLSARSLNCKPWTSLQHIDIEPINM